jgi:hypothetical protein
MISVAYFIENFVPMLGLYHRNRYWIYPCVQNMNEKINLQNIILELCSDWGEVLKFHANDARNCGIFARIYAGTNDIK